MFTKFYVDVIKDEPQQGRKWRVVLKRRSTESVVMRGKFLYRLKKDTESLVKELEELCGRTRE